MRVYNFIQWLQWLEYIIQIKLMNYNSDLPGGKQATKGHKKLKRITDMLKSVSLGYLTKWDIFSYYPGENKLHFDEIMMSTMY